MSDMFYAKGSGNNGYIKNLEVLDFNLMDGKCGMFQMQLYRTTDNRYHLYGSCFGGGQNGVMINDVTDPCNTRFVKYLQLVDPKEYPTTTTPKLQVADDLLICAMSAGSGPSSLVGYNELKNMKCEVGIRIYSLKEDPENPKFLGYWDCGVPHSIGVHRFMYNGGSYVYLSCESERFEGMILRIYDVSDPYYIKEVAYFIPPNPNKTSDESYFPGLPGPRNATTEDCCVDDRGYIYLTCLDDGFYVLKRVGDADN